MSGGPTNSLNEVAPTRNGAVAFPSTPPLGNSATNLQAPCHCERGRSRSAVAAWTPQNIAVTRPTPLSRSIVHIEERTEHGPDLEYIWKCGHLRPQGSRLRKPSRHQNHQY